MPLLDYTDIFTDIGKLIKYIDTLRTDANGYDAERDDIRATFALDDMSGLLEGIEAQYSQFKDQFITMRTNLARYSDARLQDYATVVGLLALPSSDIRSILARIITQMNIDAQSVDASTVSFGAIVGKSTNVGTPLIILSRVLDGVNSPASNVVAHREYSGLNSELVIPESDRFVCTQDVSFGSRSGEEVLTWSGELTDRTLGLATEGAGSGIGISTLNAQTLLSNKDMENFSVTNTPDNWTIAAGTITTHILKESTQVFRGAASLRFKGDGAIAAIKITQATTSLTPRQRYCVAVALKATLATGSVTMQMEGTSYTASAATAEVQTVQVSGTPSGGSYTLTESVYGQTTAAIAWNATSAAVQTALRALKGYGSVVVATSAGAPPDVTHSITFYGIQGNVPQLTSTSSLTGGAPVITHATTTPGVEGSKLVLPTAAVPTGWFIGYFMFNAPDTIPSDFALALSWSGTPANGESLYIDSFAFGPMNYFNGYAVSVIAGQTPLVTGDEYTVAVANDQAGKFQEFFRKYYGVQLPSNSAGGETIADALAT